jgi:hypothetical protein
MRPFFLYKALPLVVAAALSTVAVALSAKAEDHQLGDVNVSADHYTHVSWSRFDGPVLRLQFVADNDTVDCEHIIVTYHDGTAHDVFSGIMPKDSTETVTFPEGDSRIRNVDFACKAENKDGARITLSAVSEGDWARHDNDSDSDRMAHVRTNESTDLDRH